MRYVVTRVHAHTENTLWANDREMSTEVHVITLTDVRRLHHERGADNGFRQKAGDVHRVQRLKSASTIDLITNCSSRSRRPTTPPDFNLRMRNVVRSMLINAHKDAITFLWVSTGNTRARLHTVEMHASAVITFTYLHTHMTLTFDLRPWKRFQQFPPTRLILTTSQPVVLISPVSVAFAIRFQILTYLIFVKWISYDCDNWYHVTVF